MPLATADCFRLCIIGNSNPCLPPFFRLLRDPCTPLVWCASSETLRLSGHCNSVRRKLQNVWVAGLKRFTPPSLDKLKSGAFPRHALHGFGEPNAPAGSERERMFWPNRQLFFPNPIMSEWPVVQEQSGRSKCTTCRHPYLCQVERALFRARSGERALQRL